MKDEKQEIRAFQDEIFAPKLNETRERQVHEPYIEEAKTAKDCLKEHQQFHRQ